MPIINKKFNIAIGATVFPLQGSQYEYLPFNALVEFAMREFTGTAAEGVQATVYSGSDLLQEQSDVDYEDGNSRLRYPDDFLLQDVAAAGERIGIQMTNPGTGIAEAAVSVRITPL